MAYPLTITSSAMREINRSAILEIIRQESPIARSTIASRLDVSLPTVMRIVDQLIDEGFVRLHGSSEWSGGRRRSLLEFNGNGFVVLGVDLGGTKIYGAISDLSGNIIEEMDAGLQGAGGEDCYNRLVELIDTLLESPRLLGRKVRGIGVGAPGITLHNEGIVEWAYALNWHNFPLKDRLVERYKLPIIVDNDVNLAALGELWFGAGQNAQNMILLAIGSGIGAGIIINRALYRGSHEASGEVGHMIPGCEFLGKDHLDFGALESVASGTGIARRAQTYFDSHPELALHGKLLAGDVFKAARDNQSWAWNIVDEVVDYLAVAIANLTVAFDPDLIVLGGGVTRSADLLVEPVLERLKNAIPTPPRIVVSSLGLRAAALGAVTNLLHNTENYYIVYKIS